MSLSGAESSILELHPHIARGDSLTPSSPPAIGDGNSAFGCRPLRVPQRQRRGLFGTYGPAR